MSNIETVIWFMGGSAGFITFMWLCLTCDRALQRRAQRRHYNDIDITGLFPRNDDAYSFKPSSTAPQLVMCGGCGHNIEPGACPGAENCQYFSRIAR